MYYCIVNDRDYSSYLSLLWLEMGLEEWIKSARVAILIESLTGEQSVGMGGKEG